MEGKESNWPSNMSKSLHSVVLAHNLIGWKKFLEGCLSIEWRTYASTFLPKKHSPRLWTALLIEKLYQVVFEIWDHRCKLLHKNDLSNNIMNLYNISRKIQALLRVGTLKLCAHKLKIFYIPSATLFSKAPKFRREWLNKAENIYQNHLDRIANPSTHKKEKWVMQRWLKVVPHPTHVTTNFVPTKKTLKKQRQIIQWLQPI